MLRPLYPFNNNQEWIRVGLGVTLKRKNLVPLSNIYPRSISHYAFRPVAGKTAVDGNDLLTHVGVNLECINKSYYFLDEFVGYFTTSLSFPLTLYETPGNCHDLYIKNLCPYRTFTFMPLDLSLYRRRCLGSFATNDLPGTSSYAIGNARKLS
jgi:hypothetical protein